MPSHKIHLAIAKKVNESLNKDLNLILLGSVLPDLTVDKNHAFSHFQYKDEYPFNIAHPYDFIKKYPDMKDDISIGYLIHLLTDKYYNDYLYNNYASKGIKVNKEFKLNLYNPYDLYLLNNNLVPKFTNIDIINKIPEYKDLNFDKEYLKEYINKNNYDIDNYEKEYNKDNIELLNNLFNNCVRYILEELKKED